MFPTPFPPTCQVAVFEIYFVFYVHTQKCVMQRHHKMDHLEEVKSCTYRTWEWGTTDGQHPARRHVQTKWENLTDKCAA